MGSKESILLLPHLGMSLLKFGSSGDEVKKWQLVLMDSGYSLAPSYNDGSFGNATHNATLSWQRERGLKSDGIVGQDTWGKVNAQKVIITPQSELSITFKQAKNYTPANRTEVKYIVIHSMEAGEASTTAENVSAWFAGSSAPKASAHFCIDCDSIVQCVKETDIAWHAPGANKLGLGLEHAGYARQTRDQWLDPFSSSMLKLSAKLTAKLCKDWNIPTKFVGRDDLKNGLAGITTHHEVTQAFHESTHTDPGKGFPMDLYLQWVQEAS